MVPFMHRAYNVNAASHWPLKDSDSFGISFIDPPTASAAIIAARPKPRL
jgi:hypothetical protein